MKLNSIEEKTIPGGTERILFVDDEEQLVIIGREMLENLGYKVTGRTSSLEALELFKAGPQEYDLVITDLTMPQMTGLNLSKRIKKTRSDIPIILCTGFSQEISDAQMAAIGVDRLLLKPLVNRKLAETVREVLNEVPQLAA